MRFAGVITGFAAVSALTLALPDNASACSCQASGPPCQNAFQVDAVFAGTVRTIAALPDDGPPLGPGEARIPRTIRVEFVDVLAFRGVRGATVTVLTAGSGPACGYGFKAGERYLVYANRAAEGTGLATSICSRTRRLADAGDDLQFLQTLSLPSQNRARIYGTVTHRERDLATGQSRELGSVQDVLVSVRGLESAVEVLTDARGHYEVTVPPGKYEVTAFPPSTFSARYLQETVELRDARACFVADFSMRYDGRIKGVVRQSSGEPAAGASVEVMAAESVGKAGYIQTLRAVSDAGGGFEFSEMSPGRYVVGVDLTRRMNAEVVFPATFHPGTTNAALATVVQLDGGEQRELESMTLPPARRQHRLAGTVVFEDGRPASGVFISLSDGLATWRQVAVGIKTGSDGAFSFVVHEGLSYVARASYWDEVQRKQVGGIAGPFVVTGETGLVKVVLSAARGPGVR